MTINEILKKYDKTIIFYSRKISDDYEDYAQEMRTYVFENYKKYDPLKKVPLDYYIKMLIKTSYRKLIYDKREQHKFEDSFSQLYDVASGEPKNADYDSFLAAIVSKLTLPNQRIVFYAILYDTTGLPLTAIAKNLKMPYPTFMGTVKKIRKIINNILEQD